jgi:hypothetical protein
VLPVGTYKLSLYLENWLPVTSLLARKNSLIDIPGNSSLRALKFLQHCAAVFMKLAGFLPNSLFFPALQGISRPETRSRETACTATQSSPPADCGVGQCRRRSLTIARAMVDRAPNPALAPMTPARPIAAVSTVAPFCMTATNSEKKPAPGAGGA